MGVSALEWRRAPFFFCLAMAVAGLDEGCEKTESGRPPQGSNSKSTEAADPVVRKVNVETLARELKAHPGKVVLLDVWATWCGPCVEQFPHLSHWRERFPGLAVVALSIDSPEDLESQVLPFLRKQKTAGLELLIYAEGDHDTLVNSISKDWPGQVPATFLYDGTGKLVRSFTGTYEPADVEKALAEMMKAGS